MHKDHELLDRIFATTHFCIVYLGLNLNFIRVNQAYADACGYPPEFFPGKNHFDLYPNENIEAIFRRALATGQPYTIYANPFEFPDHPEWGVTYWDWTLHPLRDMEGAVDGLLFALLDVTERTLATQELARKTALAQLMASLARTTNQAATPQEAMRICLAKICDFGSWTLGRVVMTRELSGDFGLPVESAWHAIDSARHVEFIRSSQDISAFLESGQFEAVMLREQKPVWIVDLNDAAQDFVRRSAALSVGLRVAFSFPVIVQGKAVAFLEFFADTPRLVDPAQVAAAEIIATQIAHRVERSAAEQSRAQLAAIIENSPAAIMSCGLDRSIYTWNAAAERIFGYSAAEIIGRDALMLVPADQQAEVELRFTQLTVGAPLLEYEGVCLDKAGRRIDVLVTLFPIKDVNEHLIGISLIFRDISGSIRAEAEQALLAAIVESSNDAILIRGSDRTIIVWNAAAERLFGWTAQEAIGQPIELIVPPERVGKLSGYLESATLGEPLAPVETSHLRKDGVRIPTQVAISPVKDRHGKVVAHSFTVRDMTELKSKNEALLAYATRQRELSSRLRTVEDTERHAISRELHDRIGQGLSTLRLLLGSLRVRLSPESLRAVGKQLEDMQGLLKSIIVNVRDIMADLRPPVLDDYGLLAALRQLVTEFSQRSGVEAELSGVDLQPRLPSRMETEIFRIIQEALNNIAKHAEAKYVEISLYADSDQVVLDITDDGIGFDTNQPPPGKHHWGLSTMRERAESVSMTFHLESAPGAGTHIVLKAERTAP